MVSRGVVLGLLFLVLMVPLYWFVHNVSWRQQEETRLSLHANYVVPSSFSRILAFGFHGLLSDYQFLSTMSFFGARAVDQLQMSEDDWDYFVASLDAVTDLDPYFLDPYVLAQGLLTWEAQRYNEANVILEKGMRHRTWDWQLPYYIAFNHFYFLNDYESAGHYLMQASQLPHAPSLLKTLAARLAYYGGQSQTALLFLRQMLAETNSEQLRQRLGNRLLALERAVEIEEAMKRFRADNLRDVKHLGELVLEGYMNRLPEDPYGGDWIILENGRVYSTSHFVEPKFFAD